METYYHPHDLARFGDMGKEAPELWQKFSEWYAAVFKEGALSEREKALATGCDEFDPKPVEFERLVATIRRMVADRK